ncbi:hypothetical protein LX36DRAFT_475644 [Colletotrichum falcatum]|nr:hypothetical protein LX36DRAFT_475644 [Colletotrichum falcatum]
MQWERSLGGPRAAGSFGRVAFCAATATQQAQHTPPPIQPNSTPSAVAHFFPLFSLWCRAVNPSFSKSLFTSLFKRAGIRVISRNATHVSRPTTSTGEKKKQAGGGSTGRQTSTKNCATK